LSRPYPTCRRSVRIDPEPPPPLPVPTSHQTRRRATVGQAGIPNPHSVPNLPNRDQPFHRPGPGKLQPPVPRQPRPGPNPARNRSPGPKTPWYEQSRAYGQSRRYGQSQAYEQSRRYGQSQAYGRSRRSARARRLGQNRRFGRNHPRPAEPGARVDPAARRDPAARTDPMARADPTPRPAPAARTDPTASLSPGGSYRPNGSLSPCSSRGPNGSRGLPLAARKWLVPNRGPQAPLKPVGLSDLTGPPGQRPSDAEGRTASARPALAGTTRRDGCTRRPMRHRMPSRPGRTGTCPSSGRTPRHISATMRPAPVRRCTGSSGPAPSGRVPFTRTGRSRFRWVMPRPRRRSSPTGEPYARESGWLRRESAVPPGAARSDWSGSGRTGGSGRAGSTWPRSGVPSAGLRQITVVNPKGGAGKTIATLMLGLTFGQTRGGFVLAWDNNETQGTLGMRAQPDVHARTVRDLLRDLERFQRRWRTGRRTGRVRAGTGGRDVRRTRIRRSGTRRRGC